MIKLVASDVDGTILSYKETSLPTSFFDMITGLYEKGILFVAASGRPYCELKKLFEPVEDKMGFVCNDGALTVVKGRVIDINPMDKAEADKLMHDIYSYKDCEYLAYSVMAAYATPKTEEYKEKIKNMLYDCDVLVDSPEEIKDPVLKVAVYNKAGIEQIENYFLNKYAVELEVAYSANQWIEFNANNVDKAVGLKKIVQYLEIDEKDCMAFGDSYNDLPVFEYITNSYAVESAKDTVKNSARYICQSVEETVRKVLL